MGCFQTGVPTAGEFCNGRAVVAFRGEPLSAAAARMRDEHVGSLVVVSEVPGGDRRPVGILTDRDIVVGVVARTDRHVHAVVVGDVMSEAPITARTDEDLDAVVQRMRAHGVRRLPVVDDRGFLVGVVAFDDVVCYLQERLTDLVTLLGAEHQRERAG